MTRRKHQQDPEDDEQEAEEEVQEEGQDEDETPEEDVNTSEQESAVPKTTSTAKSKSKVEKKKPLPNPMLKTKPVVIQISEDNSVTVSQAKNDYLCCRSLCWICCFICLFSFCCVGAFVLVQVALLVGIITPKLKDEISRLTDDIQDLKNKTKS